MDDFTQNQNQNGNSGQSDDQTQAHNMISAGSIESGPISAPEVSNNNVEYGHEVIQKIEESPEHGLEVAERKEITQDDQTAVPVPQPEPQPVQPVTPPANQPKYFGYSIQPQIANNASRIKENAGKGDPTLSSTWVYVLLDRMLKMRS